MYQIVLLSLSFISGLLAGHYYLPEHSREAMNAPAALVHPAEETSVRQTGMARRGQRLRGPGPGVGIETAQSQPCVREDDTHVERLQDEYANVLIELGVSEADAQRRIETLDFPPPDKDSSSVTLESSSSAVEPSPQDIALDLERALLDSGIAPEEAHIAADNFIEQTPSAPVAPGNGSGS